LNTAYLIAHRILAGQIYYVPLLASSNTVFSIGTYAFPLCEGEIVAKNQMQVTPDYVILPFSLFIAEIL